MENKDKFLIIAKMIDQNQYEISIDHYGQIVIYTGLTYDRYDHIVSFHSEDE